MRHDVLVEYINLCICERTDGFLFDVTNLLKQHGITVGKFLGQGLHGAAFEFDNDRVIKISIAKDEMAAMFHVNTLKSLQQKNSPALATIYDVGVLGPVQMSSDRWVHKNGVAFYYIMEKMFEVPPAEVKLANRLLTDLVASPRDEKKLVFVARRVFKRDGDDVEIVDRVLQLFHDLESSNIRHQDINSGALMKNGEGEYKLIDMESARLR